MLLIRQLLVCGMLISCTTATYHYRKYLKSPVVVLRQEIKEEKKEVEKVHVSAELSKNVTSDVKETESKYSEKAPITNDQDQVRTVIIPEGLASHSLYTVKLLPVGRTEERKESDEKDRPQTGGSGGSYGLLALPNFQLSLGGSGGFNEGTGGLSGGLLFSGSGAHNAGGGSGIHGGGGHGAGVHGGGGIVGTGGLLGGLGSSGAHGVHHVEENNGIHEGAGGHGTGGVHGGGIHIGGVYEGGIQGVGGIHGGGLLGGGVLGTGGGYGGGIHGSGDIHGGGILGTGVHGGGGYGGGVISSSGIHGGGILGTGGVHGTEGSYGGGLLGGGGIHGGGVVGSSGIHGGGILGTGGIHGIGGGNIGGLLGGGGIHGGSSVGSSGIHGGGILGTGGVYGVGSGYGGGVFGSSGIHGGATYGAGGFHGGVRPPYLSSGYVQPIHHDVEDVSVHEQPAHHEGIGSVFGNLFSSLRPTGSHQKPVHHIPAGNGNYLEGPHYSAPYHRYGASDQYSIPWEYPLYNAHSQPNGVVLIAALPSFHTSLGLGSSFLETGHGGLAYSHWVAPPPFLTPVSSHHHGHKPGGVRQPEQIVAVLPESSQEAENPTSTAGAAPSNVPKDTPDVDPVITGENLETNKPEAVEEQKEKEKRGARALQEVDVLETVNEPSRVAAKTELNSVASKKCSTCVESAKTPTSSEESGEANRVQSAEDNSSEEVRQNTGETSTANNQEKAAPESSKTGNSETDPKTAAEVNLRTSVDTETLQLAVESQHI